jgi:hypothetical protein
MGKLLAYFESMCEAREAAAELEKEGYEKVHLDLAGVLDYEYASEISLPEADLSVNNASDKLSDVLMGLWSRGLYDRHTVASSFTVVKPVDTFCDGSDQKISTRLLLDIPDASADAACRIIQKNGGRISQTMV